MKPTLHGINQLSNVIVTRIPSDKINVNALIETFESNQDKATPTEWLQQYDEIASIYKILFTEGELPQEMIDKTSHEVLEMACEHISHDLEELIEEPTTSNGRDYYYEFGRSLGVEEQASKLKEHLAEDCDFV